MIENTTFNVDFFQAQVRKHREALSKHHRCSKQLVFQWLSAGQMPQVKSLAWIADVCGVKAGDFFTDADENLAAATGQQ